MKYEDLRNIFPLLLEDTCADIDKLCALMKVNDNRFAEYNTLNNKASLYLNSALHDSELLSITHKKDTLSIVFDDFFCCSFAGAINTAVGAELKKCESWFPVSLNFVGLKDYKVYALDESDVVRTKTIDVLTAGFEHCGDEMIEFSKSKIRMGIMLSHNPESDAYIIEITADKLIILDNPFFYFEKMFGGRFLDAFKKFWELRKNRTFLEQWQMRKLVEASKDSHHLK